MQLGDGAPRAPDGVERAVTPALEPGDAADLVVRDIDGIVDLAIGGVEQPQAAEGKGDGLAQGLAPDLDTPTSFVGTWLRILKPGFEALSGRGLDYEARIAALEREAVLVSLANLMTFPFVRAGVEAGRLQLHGVWKDIRDGGLEVYDPAAGFRPL